MRPVVCLAHASGPDRGRDWRRSALRGASSHARPRLSANAAIPAGPQFAARLPDDGKRDRRPSAANVGPLEPAVARSLASLVVSVGPRTWLPRRLVDRLFGATIHAILSMVRFAG